MSTLHEMFEDGLKDIYNAEKQMSKALPRMMKMAKSPELRIAIEGHLAQTEQHAKRVEEACQSIGTKPTGMVCQGMKGLVEEATEHMKGKKSSVVTDAEIIALAQKAEHYEIATYGSLCEWAKVMGHEEAHRLLKMNMAEEELTDKKLSQIAESTINLEAARMSKQDMMGNGHSKPGTMRRTTPKASPARRTTARRTPSRSR